MVGIVAKLIPLHVGEDDKSYAALCAALAFSLAGCMEQAASDVSDTASRIESGAGEAVSRVESGMEEAGSRVGSAVESALDPDENREPSPSPQAR